MANFNAMPYALGHYYTKRRRRRRVAVGGGLAAVGAGGLLGTRRGRVTIGRGLKQLGMKFPKARKYVAPRLKGLFRGSKAARIGVRKGLWGAAMSKWGRAASETRLGSKLAPYLARLL